MLNRDIDVFCAQVETTAGKYFLNVCNGPVNTASECTGSAVCYVPEGQKAMSYGLLSKMEAVWNGDDLKVTYSEGVKCLSGAAGEIHYK